MTAVLLSSGPGDDIQASATVIIQFFDSSDTFPRLSVLPQLVLTEAGRQAGWLNCLAHFHFFFSSGRSVDSWEMMSTSPHPTAKKIWAGLSLLLLRCPDLYEEVYFSVKKTKQNRKVKNLCDFGRISHWSVFQLSDCINIIIHPRM